MSTNHDRGQPGAAGDDPALVHAWRQASDEQPPERLDAAILAAARRSVDAQDPVAPTRSVPVRTRSRWMKWQPLAAAATVAGLAFVLIQTLPREREVATPIRVEVPAAAPALERQVAPPVPGDALAVTPAPDFAQRLHERGTAGTARAPAAEVAPDVADTMQQAETDLRKGVVTDASGNSASREAAAPAARRTETVGLSTAARPSAADRATQIEVLHVSGDLAAASAALREFRAADPDADSYLPESLRDWARTVR
jgi:hypothetical protein